MANTINDGGPALKPCPFCGNTPVERRIVELYSANADGPAGEYDAHHTISCDHCGIDMSAEYRDDVATAWNRRAARSSSMRNGE